MLIFLASLSLVIWLFLLLFWGGFWLANQRLVTTEIKLIPYPTICAIVPARNEADVLPTSIASLLNQDYLGTFSIVLVDDNSSDRTREVTQKIATELNKQDKIQIVAGQPLAAGWKGKLWAIKQGIDRANKLNLQPEYFLFTDADIQHDCHNLLQLVTKAETENLDLVSLMVLLRCQSFWEKLLIPAFVFFFQKLYPFSWVNDRDRSLAAAAGGCLLIRRQALENIGGIDSIKDALIDDCTLAKAIKSNKAGIWLGLTETTISLRAYEDLKTIWSTIARTAYTQLNYSPLLLIITVLGMGIVYLIPPIFLLIGLIITNWILVIISLMTWLLMTIAYLPTIRLYKLSILWAFSLPAIALLYTLMTIDSAGKHYQGKGGAWKGRIYSNVGN
ncbi:MAG: glycosyltransferase [Pleurocapsa sp.]